jgi:hypothetical protein
MIARSNAHDFRPFFASISIIATLLLLVDPLIFANVLAQRSRWAIEIID